MCDNCRSWKVAEVAFSGGSKKLKTFWKLFSNHFFRGVQNWKIVWKIANISTKLRLTIYYKFASCSFPAIFNWHLQENRVFKKRFWAPPLKKVFTHFSLFKNNKWLQNKKNWKCFSIWRIWNCPNYNVSHNYELPKNGKEIYCNLWKYVLQFGCFVKRLTIVNISKFKVGEHMGNYSSFRGHEDASDPYSPPAAWSPSQICFLFVFGVCE